MRTQKCDGKDTWEEKRKVLGHVAIMNQLQCSGLASVSPISIQLRKGISVLRNGGITATHLTNLQKWVGYRRKTGFQARTLWKGPGRTTKPGLFKSKGSGERWEVRQLLNGKHGSGRWEGSRDRLGGFAQGSHHSKSLGTWVGLSGLTMATLREVCGYTVKTH